MKTMPRSFYFQNLGMLVIRLFTGWFIIRYGMELFNINGLIEFLTAEKILFPVFSAYAAKIIELVGGILLMLGLFTRWITPPLMVVMYAVIYVTAKGSIFEGEVAFLFMLLFGVFFFQGAGFFSFDYLIKKYRNRNQQLS